MIYEKLKETNKCVTTQCMHKKIYSTPYEETRHKHKHNPGGREAYCR